ncbi:pirin family protein [Paenibacillus sp. NPDC058174]|uniref:pirin family protein n=1 Tax=Paenibacillus sp. NPDC058174 TaxID=3346366 RepID=UPI0036DA6502
MNDMVMKQRIVEKQWAIVPQKRSEVHTAAPILEPGKWQQFDPFLLWMDDWFSQGAFGEHPHRGMETVSYVIEGAIEHYDDKGHEGRLEAGDVQWMTAGRGVVHNEIPPEGVTTHLLQLWVNLPAEHKMAEPRTQLLKRDQIPVRREEGVEIYVISGESGDVKASTLNYAPITMLEINLERGASFTQSLAEDHNAFLYILEGEGRFGSAGTLGEKGQLLALKHEKEASELLIQASEEPLKLLLIAGKPLREPIAAHGPFVMNTPEQIVQAYDDFRSGNF